MPIQTPDDRFNVGLAVFLEWGPRKAIPIQERLAEALAELSKAEIPKLLAEYQEIYSMAHQRVIDQLESKQTEEAGRNSIADIDPRLSSENAEMLYTQARVSALRDGYQ